MKEIWQFILEHYKEIGGGILGLYEVITRLFPNTKTWSILTFIIRLINWIVPDKKRSINGRKERHK